MGWTPVGEAAGRRGEKLEGRGLSNIQLQVLWEDWIKGSNQMHFAIRVRDLYFPKCFTLTVGFQRFDRFHFSSRQEIKVLNKTHSTVRTLLTT